MARLIQAGWIAGLVGTYVLALTGFLDSQLGFSSRSTSYDSYSEVGLAEPLVTGDTTYVERFAPPFYDKGIRVWREIVRT